MITRPTATAGQLSQHAGDGLGRHGHRCARTRCWAITREPYETLTWPFAMMGVRRLVSPSEEPLPLCLSHDSLNERALALILSNPSPSRPAQHTRDVSKAETIWNDSRCKEYVQIKPD